MKFHASVRDASIVLFDFLTKANDKWQMSNCLTPHKNSRGLAEEGPILAMVVERIARSVLVTT